MWDTPSFGRYGVWPSLSVGHQSPVGAEPGTSSSVIREGSVITAIHHPVSPMVTLPIISHGAHRTEHLLLKGPEIWFPEATSLFVLQSPVCDLASVSPGSPLDRRKCLAFRGTDMQIQYQRGFLQPSVFLPRPHLKGQRLAFCSPCYCQGKPSSKMQRRNKSHPKGMKRKFYFGTKYEWSWPGNTDLCLAKYHIPMKTLSHELISNRAKRTIRSHTFPIHCWV